MQNNKKFNLAIFSDGKLIAVKVCKSEVELEMVKEEYKNFGYETETGFYHFDASSKKMIWRGKGHSNRSKNAIKHVFEKKLIQSY